MESLKKLSAAACAAAFILTGCQEERFEENRYTENYRASVETFDNGTRTAIGEGCSVVWTSGDRIAIFEENSKGKAYQVLDSYAGSRSGEFSQVEGVETDGAGAEFDGTIAIYPFSEDLTVTAGEDDTYIIGNVSFPSEQQYISGSFSDDAFPMTARTSPGSKDLSFKNIGGVLKLRFKGDYAVSTITVKGNCGEAISGTAEVTLGPDGIPSVRMSAEASGSVTLSCDPAVQLDPDIEQEFYISIPPTSFEAGFTVKVTDSEGNSYRRQTVLANPISRSIIHIMPPTDLMEDISDDATENYIDLGIGRNAQITSYSEASGSISLEYSSTAIPVIEAGKAFVLPIEHGGGIRVIDGHATAGSTVTLQTSEGNMCDLFKNTSFTLSTSSEPDTRSSGEWDVITPSTYGYLDENGTYHEVFNEENFTRSSDDDDYTEFVNKQEIWSFKKDYENHDIFSNSAGRLYWEKCLFEAGLAGKFSFDFGEKKINEIKSVGDLNFCSYVLSGSYNIDMLLTYEFQARYSNDDDGKIEVENILKPGVFKFVVGGVPVFIIVNTHLGAQKEFTAEGQVRASAGLNVGTEVQMGVMWSPANGFQEIKRVIPTREIYEPELEIGASASARISFYPRIEFKIYNFFGPWVEPRPYIEENIEAGLRISTDNENHMGWKAVTSTGLDLNLGLSLGFGKWEVEPWKGVFPMSVTDIFEAPARITRISPEQGIEIQKGQSVEAIFKAESYSSITDQYYPCPAALIYFGTDGGTYTPKATVADMHGFATTRWTPGPKTATRAATEHNLTARIIDHEGSSIDETTLTVTAIDPEQWVDLGLSVLWAGWNVGAGSPEEYGGYYAWGETEEKGCYSWDNYKYKYVYIRQTGDEEAYHSASYLGDDISGTVNDVAYVKWGDGARMPTPSEVQELLENCWFTISEYNGVSGVYVTGPSGKEIFIPYSGYQWGEKDQSVLFGAGTDILLWSSGWHPEFVDGFGLGNFSYMMTSHKVNADITNGDFSMIERWSGLPVRPVRNHDGSNKPGGETAQECLPALKCGNL